MTRRERMAARAERRREWADGAQRRAGELFEAAREAVDGIPFGQPILVGHHSERHHRRDLERHDSRMHAACERSTMAARHEQAAETLERRLETTIFSDDDDAIAQLEARISGREADAARIRELNKAMRKEFKGGPPAPGWLERIGASEREQRQILDNARHGNWGAGTKPDEPPVYPAWVLSNLSGANSKDRERLAGIRRMQKRQAEAEAAPGGVAVVRAGTFAVLTFSEKPDRSVLDALKSAGFWWAAGSWQGPADKLPAGILPEVCP
jgi:hypothetical protein